MCNTRASFKRLRTGSWPLIPGLRPPPAPPISPSDIARCDHMGSALAAAGGRNLRVVGAPGLPARQDLPLAGLRSAPGSPSARDSRSAGIGRHLALPVHETVRPSPSTHLIREHDSMAGPATRRLHVLLAEDHPVNQKLAVRLLEKRGHSVVVVEDGAAAVAATAREGFDMVLMDIQMPRLSGLEA